MLFHCDKVLLIYLLKGNNLANKFFSRDVLGKLILVFSLVFIISALYFLSNIKPKKTASAHIYNYKGMVIEGLDFVDLDLDTVRLRVKAEKAQLVNRQYGFFRLALGKVLELDKPDFEIFNEGGKIEIKAVGALVDPEKKSVTFQGEVEVLGADSGNISADRLIWEYSRSRIEIKGGYALKRAGKSVKIMDTDLELDLPDAHGQKEKKEAMGLCVKGL